MIYSNQDILSDAQAVTATAPSTNVIDIGAAGTPYGAPAAIGRDLGNIPDLIDVDARVVQAFNNLTSLKVALEASDDNATFTEVASRTYLLAEINATKRLDFPSNLIRGVNKRYFRLNYTVTGTAPTTGKITAAIVPGHQSN